MKLVFWLRHSQTQIYVLFTIFWRIYLKKEIVGCGKLCKRNINALKTFSEIYDGVFFVKQLHRRCLSWSLPNLVLNINILKLIRVFYWKFLAEWIVSIFRVLWSEIRNISLYSVRMREKRDQKNSEYGHFSRTIFS